MWLRTSKGGLGGRVSRALQGLRAKLPLEKSLNVQISNKSKIKISQRPKVFLSRFPALGVQGLNDLK